MGRINRQRRGSGTRDSATITEVRENCARFFLPAQGWGRSAGDSGVERNTGLFIGSKVCRLEREVRLAGGISDAEELHFANLHQVGAAFYAGRAPAIAGVAVS